MKLLTRLLWAVLPLLAVSILVTALGLSLYSQNTVTQQAKEDGQVLANVLARSAGMSGTVEEATDMMISRDLTSSANILAQFVAVAEQCKLPPKDINKRLRSIVSQDDLSEIWITDSHGKAYLHSEPINDFQFTSDPFRHPQSSRFWPLLSGKPAQIIQGVVPRELDGKPFKYVGVSGIDKPRIVQVGLDGHLLESLRTALGVQELLNRVVSVDLIERIWVVNEHLDTLNFASDKTPNQTEKVISEQEQAYLRNVIKKGNTFSEFVNDVISIGAPIKREIHNNEYSIFDPLKHAPNRGDSQNNEGTEVIGAILLHIPTAILTKLISNEILITAGTTLGILLLGALTLISFTRRVVGPVTTVTDAATALQRGHFKSTDLDLICKRQDEVGTLATVFQGMANELTNQRETLEKQVLERTSALADKNHQLESAQKQIEGELGVAHALQQAILPTSFPKISGYSGSGKMKPAKQLAGDFYDFIPLKDGKIGVLIADVSDKGVTASFFMAISRTILRYEAEQQGSPAECLEQANKRIYASNPMMLFVTVFYGVLTPETGEFVYSNGGHLLPYIFNINASPREIGATDGALLGISEDIKYTQNTIHINVGDRLFLFSDGITEAFDPDNKAYGDNGLIQCLDQLKDRTGDEIVKKVIDSVELFANGAAQSDDITAVALVREL
jgi:sigma-B regulation protein RsbU (phosphoserine phosphatase)